MDTPRKRLTSFSVLRRMVKDRINCVHRIEEVRTNDTMKGNNKKAKSVIGPKSKQVIVEYIVSVTCIK